MRSLLKMLFCALALAGFVQAANAADAPPPTQGPVYVTTFFEVTPGNTAPLSSRTVPLICAVACAQAADAVKRRIKMPREQQVSHIFML